MRAIVGSLLLVLAVVLVGLGCGDSPEGITTTATEPRPADRGDGGGGGGGGADTAEAPRPGDGRGGVALDELGDFASPLYVTQPTSGDPGHVYVVEKCGTVQRVPIGGGQPEPFMDISDLVSCGSEQGLLSIAFAPDYERSRLLYVDYTDTEGDTRVVEYEAAGNGSSVDPDSARELLFVDQPYDNHNGGLVLFGPDDNLYIGLGDGGSSGDPERRGQDLSTPLGKILRIDPQPDGKQPYAIPPDNPFVNTEGARPEILISGVRNPWRYSFDRDSGDLWIGDVGQDALEEIDFAPADRLDQGLNFGWSAFEGSQPFNQDEEAPGAIAPVLEYPLAEACAVTGGYVVRDQHLTSLYGRYLYADFCLGELRSFLAEPPQRGGDDRDLGLQIPSVSSFGEDAEGRLYVTSLDGPVYRLAPTGGG